LTKCSRFILHPLKQKKARSLGVAAVVLEVIIAILFVIIFLFFFFFGLLSKENVGSDQRIRRV